MEALSLDLTAKIVDWGKKQNLEIKAVFIGTTISRNEVATLLQTADSLVPKTFVVTKGYNSLGCAEVRTLEVQ